MRSRNRVAAERQLDLLDPKAGRERPVETPDRIDSVLVEAQTSDAMYRVDLATRTCTCGRGAQGKCLHVQRAVDVHEGRCKNSKYEFVSVMHKEIRRGDVEAALHFADLIAKGGEYYLKQYVRGIVGEETRNMDLFWICVDPGKRSYRDMVAAIAGSRKKWEHPNVCRLYKEQMRGWSLARRQVAAAGSAAALARRAPDAFHQAVKDRKTMEAMQFFWWMYFAQTEAEEAAEEEAGEELRPPAFSWRAFDDVLLGWVKAAGLAIDRPDELLGAVHKTGRNGEFELRLGFIEGIFGGWDETMNAYPHQAGRAFDYADGRIIRRVPDYAYDKHTHLGKKWLREHLADLRPGRGQPGRLDMRWSGQFYGVSWRYAAYVQHGDDYVRKRWEEVRWTQEFWDLTVAFDED